MAPEAFFIARYHNGDAGIRGESLLPPFLTLPITARLSQFFFRLISLGSYSPSGEPGTGVKVGVSTGETGAGTGVSVGGGTGVSVAGRR
jgi:hypothetical protein